MLESGKTPEELCHDCPELLPEVRQRWREFCVIDAEVEALLPDPVTRIDPDPTLPGPKTSGLPRIPGYEVEAILGHGGMGLVYKARHRALDRPVAIKMLLSGSFAGPQELARFRREAEALAGLRHPNIVQVYDAGDVEGHPYFTMEFMEGGSLARRLAATTQPPKRAARIGGDSCGWRGIRASQRDCPPRFEAGQYPAQRPTAHRRSRTSDWPGDWTAVPGLTLEWHPDRDAELHGPRASPAANAGHRSGRRRVRSWGDPLRAADGWATVPRRDASGNTSCKSLPGAGVAFAVESESAARPRDDLPQVLAETAAPALSGAGVLADDLRRFGEGRPIQARPVGWVERSWRWSQRNPTTAGLLAGLLALFVLTVGGGLWFQGQRVERQGRAREAIERRCRSSRTCGARAAGQRQKRSSNRPGVSWTMPAPTSYGTGLAQDAEGHPTGGRA